ncbi:heptaprenyl diphosphate synthase component 1 [Thalassobacillus pellis]|uniref:heptaprenyl diphosphate synthase component 1 n=1 Tax=Thalassobacillus pellis TaxID=748008 RepID=UPI0030844637|nr:heptaprenyl diphosphate synthase [Thalassobacillus pellis]
MTTVELDIKHLKQKIADKVRHPFLAKFVSDPIIDEDKLVILTSIMDNTGLSPIKKEQYIITTMLVQIALDTHDLVSLSDSGEDQVTVRNRQLTVLAGDYYSGMYYYLLSQLDDIPMIHTLASAIKDINEQKMELYYKDVESFQEFMNGLKTVESLLIQRVAEYVKRASINDVAGEWLLTKKLLNEQRNVQQDGYSPLLDLLVKDRLTNTTYSQIMKSVDLMIQRNLSRLEVTISHLPLHFNNLKSYVHTTLSEQHYQNQVAEEG